MADLFIVEHNIYHHIDDLNSTDNMNPILNLNFTKVSTEQVSLPKWLPFSKMHPVDYYSTVTKNCSGNFSEQEIRDIRASYYAMCAETDSMLGKQILFNISRTSSNPLC